MNRIPLSVAHSSPSFINTASGRRLEILFPDMFLNCKKSGRSTASGGMADR
jgi:hypothetical protein